MSYFDLYKETKHINTYSHLSPILLGGKRRRQEVAASWKAFVTQTARNKQMFYGCFNENY